MLAIVLGGVSCSGDSEPDERDADGSEAAAQPVQTGPARTDGDECEDDVGDLSQNALELEGSLDEPAGVDLVGAEAELVGESPRDLRVRFEVAGDLGEAEEPVFTVFQGPPAELTSWEIRAVHSGDGWQVESITYEPEERALATARVAELDAPLEIGDDGRSIEFTVAADDLPPIATLLWAFGSSATTGDGVVFDDCSNLG